MTNFYYAFIISMAVIIFIIPLINLSYTGLSSISIDFCGVSISLLSALFAQLLMLETYSIEVLFLLVLLVVFHVLFIPAVIFLYKRHMSDNSVFFKNTAYPLALIFAEILLFSTTMLTLNSRQLISYNSDQKATLYNLLSVVLENTTLMLCFFIALLIVLTIIRLFVLPKIKSI